jgi:Domain of unknown function (DUF4397)
MRLGRRLAVLAAVATLLGGPVAATVAGASAASAATPASAATSNGWVRCANLSPGTPEDVYLYPFGDPGHPVVLKHAEYGEVYDYMAVSAGEYTVAMRPVGAPASSSPSVSTSFMVSAGANYTVASLGSPADRQLKVLQDQMASSKGDVLVRVIQASVKQPKVTVSIGSTVLARELAFGSATSYQTVPAGSPTVTFTAPGGHAAMAVTLAAGSVHTIVVLDGASGLQVDSLTDAAASQDTPQGGAATGLGGTAPGSPEVGPWLATLVGGLLLAATGGLGLRKSRSMVTSG